MRHTIAIVLSAILVTTPTKLVLAQSDQRESQVSPNKSVPVRLALSGPFFSLVSMTEMTSQLSTALADRYQIEREIGSGGMATVSRGSRYE